jgi:tetratricopeptide (TPR) repeat protein
MADSCFPFPFRRRQLPAIAEGRQLLPLVALSLLALVTCVAQTHAQSESFDALARQAADARDANRLDDAVTLYKKGLALHPKWAEGWWSLGTLEYDRNNYAAAVRAFRRLLPLAPKNGTAAAMLGLSEFELGQDAAALQHIRQGRALGVANNQQLHEVTLYHEGVLLLRAGNFKLAQSTFATLCREGVENDELREGLALAVLRSSPRLPPPHGSPGADVVQQVGRAACLTAQKKFDQAKQEYVLLLKDFPNYPNLHYAFGLHYVEANAPLAAIEEFKEEIARDPQNVAARLDIAAAFYKVDSLSGVPYAEEAVKLNPKLPFGHYLLGLLYLDTNDYLKAIPELETARNAFPKEAKVYFALGSAYSRAGRKQEAAQARATFERLSKQTSTTNSTIEY